MDHITDSNVQLVEQVIPPLARQFTQPHGIGVDIYKAPGVGGIEFNFDKPDPDEWRLGRHIEAQVNDAQLPYAVYRELLEGEHTFKAAVASALRGARHAEVVRPERSSEESHGKLISLPSMVITPDTTKTLNAGQAD